MLDDTTRTFRLDGGQHAFSTNGSQKERMYSMVDLFAGCGGLSLGFENANFKPVFVSELNDDALGSYLINRHHSLGGLKFSDNKSLRCNDAHDLDDNRLEKLKSDFKSIPEISFSTETFARKTTGGGSTLDVVTGGPPCQGFSGIGHRRSYSVSKGELPSNRLYVRMAKIISSLRPRLFLFENVRGILNSKWSPGGEDYIWPDVLAEYRKIEGYTVRWKLVHAKDYGVPQNRPRVLLVGIRNDIVEACEFLSPQFDPEDAVKCGFLPSPVTGNYPDLIELLGDLIDPEIDALLRSGSYPAGSFATKKYLVKPQSNIQKKLRSNSFEGGAGYVTDLTEQEYSKHAPLIVQKFAFMISNDGRIPEELQTKKFSQRLLPPKWGKQGPTITATSMPDDYVHFSQPRILTVREWARLQLFPDWYKFVGKRTTGGIRRAGNPREGNFDREVPKYTQIGNAVPVGLAESVGAHFKLILDNALGSNA